MARMNRRDLLKYFAAGTLIAPVAGAAPVARLIEAPKVELFQPEAIAKPFNFENIHHALIQFEMMDGSSHCLPVNDIYFRYGSSLYRSLSTGDECHVQLNASVDSQSSPGVLLRVGQIEGVARLR